MALRYSAYELLDKIAKISDKKERKAVLRQTCSTVRPIALLIQYTYHPDVHFDLPRGIDKLGNFKRSKHTDFNVTYSNIRKLNLFWKSSPITPEKKIELFTGLLRDVVSDDVELLVGVKDGVLPWKTLNRAFCVNTLPELFPPSEEKEAEDNDILV